MLKGDKNRDELILQYIEGTMSSENISSFEKLIEEDEDLADEIELFKQLNEHYNYHEISNSANTKDLEEYFRSDEAIKLKKVIEKAGQIHSRKKRFKFSNLIAASIIGIMICVAGYFQFNYNNLYEDYYNDSDLPSLISRGESENSINEILLAFQKKQFSKANNLYISYTESTINLNENIYIYGGMTYLELNEFDKAINEFHKMTISNSIDHSKGLWFTALVYMKSKETDQLKKTLLLIVESKDNFNYDEANSILNKID